jgi:hypothetical protein
MTEDLDPMPTAAPLRRSRAALPPKETRGRKARYPKKTARITFKMPTATLVAVQRHAAKLTERDGYPCSMNDAVCDCIHVATGTARPAGTIDRIATPRRPS